MKATGSMAAAFAAPRCGAKTRAGTPCQQAAVTGNRRCRMHGGARGTGRPPSHGWYTKNAVAARQKLREILDGAPLTTFTAALGRLAQAKVPAFISARLDQGQVGRKPHTKGPNSAFGFPIRTP